MTTEHYVVEYMFDPRASVCKRRWSDTVGW